MNVFAFSSVRRPGSVSEAKSCSLSLVGRSGVVLSSHKICHSLRCATKITSTCVTKENRKESNEKTLWFEKRSAVLDSFVSCFGKRTAIPPSFAKNAMPILNGDLFQHTVMPSVSSGSEGEHQ